MNGSPPEGPREVVLVRHAETEWSLNGRHTGNTDIPLTEHGRALARTLAPELARWRFALVLVSPLRRARETCELCGLGPQEQLEENLREWDYGDYEGLTTPEIRAQDPDWVLWRDGCPGGESPAQVGARADRLLARIASAQGPVALFSHGHMLRVTGARWIEGAPALAAHLGLSPAAISLLGYERQTRILARWNDTCASRGES